MPQVDFTGLMNEGNQTPNSQQASLQSKYDFKGLMQDSVQSKQPKQKIKQKLSQPDLDKFINERIKARGTTFSEFSPDTRLANRIMTGLKTVNLPFELGQSAIANPIIAMQQGNFNPLKLAKESLLGLTGQKQGEFKDIPRGAGVPELASNVIGFMSELAVPSMLFKAANKLGAVSKYADKRTAKAINSFIKAVEGKNGALNKVGGKVQKFYDEVGNISVDKDKLLNQIVKASSTAKKHMSGIPNVNIKEAEDVLINMAQKGTVNSVRVARQKVDDLITQWTNAAAGKDQTIEQTLLMDISKNLNNIADDAVRSVKGAKYVNKFKKARLDYSKLKRGYKSIQRRMINFDTGEPTKTGQLLKEILDSRESDLRTTLSKLNKFGTKSNKFAQDLKSIENAIRRREFLGRVARGAGFTAAIGATLKATGATKRITGTREQSVSK